MAQDDLTPDSLRTKLAAVLVVPIGLALTVLG